MQLFPSRVQELSVDQHVLSEAFLSDPYPYLAWLREHAPVLWSEPLGGWVITRHADVMQTFLDVEHFSNEGRLARAVEYLPTEQRERLVTFESHYRTKGLLHSDPPDHTRLRRLAQKAFSPRTVEAMRPSVSAIVERLLDRCAADGGMEVIADFAFALPVAVLAEILGVPQSDTPKFQRWANALLAFQGVNRPPVETLMEAQQAIVETREYLSDLILAKRAAPANDLLTELVQAESDGDRLGQDELINTCVTLLVAGHETTTSLIGNGLWLLLTHQDQWQRLRQDHSLVPSAVEEILRMESPVARQSRLVRGEVELQPGCRMTEGQIVFQMLGSVNRDDTIFADPDTFDVGRDPNRHLAFGFGPHFCIGAPLSRLEGHLAFHALLNRFPTLKLVEEEPSWHLQKPNSRVLRLLDVTV